MNHITASSLPEAEVAVPPLMDRIAQSVELQRQKAKNRDAGLIPRDRITASPLRAEAEGQREVAVPPLIMTRSSANQTQIALMTGYLPVAPQLAAGAHPPSLPDGLVNIQQVS